METSPVAPRRANCFLAINPIKPRAGAETATDLIGAAMVASAALRARPGRPGDGRDDLRESVLELRRELRTVNRVGRHWLGRTKDDLENRTRRPVRGVIWDEWWSGLSIRGGRWTFRTTWKVSGKVPRREWGFLVAAANACLHVSTRNALAVAECLPVVMKACQRPLAASPAHVRRTKRPLPTRARHEIGRLEQQLKQTLTRTPESGQHSRLLPQLLMRTFV
jgi:hypothetical protein